MHESLRSENLVWLIPTLPLAGFFVNAFIGRRLNRAIVGGLATAVVLASFVISIIVLCDLQAMGGERRALVGLLPGGVRAPWISIGGLTVDYGALVDPLSMLMCLIVTGVGGLIHLYATGYMAHDRDYSRFFTYFNLFIFAMLTLVLGDSLLLMFVGWEGVGLCSYLLISFWFEDPANARAGNKAFIVNRVGDLGFALGMMTIFAVFGTLAYHTADGKGVLDLALAGHTAQGGLTAGIATVIALLLFVGAAGKSAQFPLYVWLPDAMAGPTPVSALIHAATMVTAGVVMVTRMSPVFVHSPVAMLVVAIVGAFTAFFAATIALTQTDIKKVLAYSTVSQLGYMFLACGVGAFSAGMFHVTTHAFFKALLFLGAGSVIHALSGEQDMRKMGGLAGRIPVTYRTMWIGWLAIAGFPGLAGFWSKDEILGYAAGQPAIGAILYGAGIITALLTAVYMTRMMAKTFWTSQRFTEAAGGDDHGGHGHGEGAAQVHESPPSMTIPLIVLAFLSVVGGLIGTPWMNVFERFLEPSVAPVHPHEGLPLVVGLGVSAIVGIGAMLVVSRLYARRTTTGDLLEPATRQANPMYRGSLNLWYVDSMFSTVFIKGGGRLATAVWTWVDRFLIDGLVNGVALLIGGGAEVLRRVQTGYVRSYALTMALGIAALLGGVLFLGGHR